jgi:hypothetical protein
MNATMMSRSWRSAVLALALVLGAPSLRAQPTSTQRAAAEALFQRAIVLMEAEHYAEACEKFQASQELDPTLGTMLYLADCYELAGKTASAWALFQAATLKARHSGHAERERIAKERAADLQRRLSLLELRVKKKHASSGLELFVNGVRVPAASLSTPLPVDPGSTRVEARAPDKKRWSTSLTIPPGPVTRVVEIPALENLPRSASAASARGRHSDLPATESSARTTLGYVTGAAGIAALVAGGIFGYRAFDQNRQSKAECRSEDPNRCTKQGIELRDDARDSAALSTIATISGTALVVGGVVILLTAGSPASERSGARRRGGRVGLAEGVALELGGVF